LRILNPDEGLWKDRGTHFSWFARCRHDITDFDRTGIRGWQYDHTSWRRSSRLIDGIKTFPDTRIGEDSRLTYASLLNGGTALGIKRPLTNYVLPIGSVKRQQLKLLMEWDREHSALNI